MYHLSLRRLKRTFGQKKKKAPRTTDHRAHQQRRLPTSQTPRAALGLAARPTRAAGRGPASVALGTDAAGEDTGRRRPPGPGRAPAAPTTSGLRPARPAPSLAARRHPHLTCGLSSSVSSMGSLSIPGIVAEGGQQMETRRPPTAPHSDPPSLAGPVAVPARADLTKRPVVRREIPPPWSRCSASWRSRWLAVMSISAAGWIGRFLRLPELLGALWPRVPGSGVAFLGGHLPRARARASLNVNCRVRVPPPRASPGTRTLSQDRTGEFGTILVFRQHLSSETMEEALVFPSPKRPVSQRKGAG